MAKTDAPKIALSTSAAENVVADVLVLGIRSADDHAGLSELLDLMGFTGEAKQVLTFPSTGLVKAGRVMAVALPEAPTAEDLRRAAGRAVRSLRSASSIAVALHPASVAEVGAIAEGIQLGAYEFTTYKSSKRERDDQQASAPAKLAKVSLISAFARQKAAQRAVDEAAVVSSAVNIARDWVNMPPADLRPPAFAEAIAEHASSELKVTVWDEKRLAKERCSGLIGVGSGSQAAPRLVQLTYSPSDATTSISLVGKGITFDSGGLSIKPGTGMMTMKCDMAGAAAVVAATIAIARLGLPIAVTTYACLAENMPSGSATRPGDVLTMRDGTTVEVHNTDAEGRLVLADGLLLASETKPDRIIDVATLTGAAVVALGSYTSGVLGTDAALIDQVLAAAEVAGEATWQLPITEEMKPLVRSSKVADVLQHNPKPAGGTIFAAAFLREFVGDGLAWAHLDIAGPAFNDAAASDYTPAGGTGASVRTLIELARTTSAER